MAATNLHPNQYENKTKIKAYYFPVSDDPEESERLTYFLSKLCGLNFVTESAIPGTLDELLTTLKQSTYSFSAKKY